MPGMNSGLSPGDPTLVAAFRLALLHQGEIVLLAIAFRWLVWATARTWRPATPAGTGPGNGAGTPEARVPPGTGTLAPGPGNSYDALAVAGSKLTVWRLAQGASWAKVQLITVPIECGSSG